MANNTDQSPGCYQLSDATVYYSLNGYGYCWYGPLHVAQSLANWVALLIPMLYLLIFQGKFSLSLLPYPLAQKIRHIIGLCIFHNSVGEAGSWPHAEYYSVSHSRSGTWEDNWRTWHSLSPHVVFHVTWGPLCGNSIHTSAKLPFSWISHTVDQQSCIFSIPHVVKMSRRPTLVGIKSGMGGRLGDGKILFLPLLGKFSCRVI